MSQSGETSASASPSIGANAPNEFVFVIHQESNVGRYYQFLFKRMYNCSELSDVTLRCDDRDIPAHRIVLAAHSPFFVKQFEEKPTNGLIIAIDNVKHNILMAAMELMYHGTVSIEPHSEPAFRELMENFEMSALMVNPNKFKANAVSQTVVKNVNREVKATETVNIEEKKRRVELHGNFMFLLLPSADELIFISISDIRELSEYDHFVSAIDGIIRTVTKDNIEAKAGDLLRHNIYTKERLVTVANLIMRQVISIGCETPTICYAKVSAAIKSRDRTTNGFSSILLGICQKFFTANIERKLEQPDCLDEPTLSSFDQQIHTLRMIEYHYLHERLRRIVRFLSELYTQNVINGGLLLDIQANQFANLDSGCHDYFFVLLAIFEAAGKMLSEEHPTYTNDCVAKLKQRLIAMGNKQILPDVKALITQAIEMSESGWEKKCELEPNTSNESLPNSDIEEHLFWIKNSVSC